MPAALMTPDELAARTARAVEAATAAGRGLGLTVTDARVLHDMFSVVVHLAPSPVVVRVPTVLPPYAAADPAFQAQRQQRELDVVHWLAEQGHRVIPPSPLVPREPVRRDGFSMTFWAYAETDAAAGAEPDYVHHSRLVAGLHDALRGYPGELPFLAAAEPRFVTDGLDALGSRPDLIEPGDLDRARHEWEVLEPVVRSRAAFEAAFPGVALQPVHGDAPAVNIIAGADGPLYSDFELVSLGPVEWDLAGMPPGCAAAYDEAARERGLRPLNERVLRFASAVGMARAVACLALVPQLPLLKDALRPALDHWRTTPFDSGLPG
ncbi:aminoglycoside phosphotransferase family protein [Streptomyces sp. 7-21]|jgi:hypothetical protein|uniref:aminoglycoside phosphotransferase family protein n=1 Tax=Streptomyces sp. 7-21 TaxID=2802283 RepID=UPI001F322D24|nr:aminoglycoside phosphotransferase family protein [Streptomyces sp. 7-21]